MNTYDILKNAKKAAPSLALLDTKTKNAALSKMSEAIIMSTEEILYENSLDIEAAKDSISSVMLDRLKLTEERIKAMAKGINEVIMLDDPVFSVAEEKTRPNGLLIKKVHVPMGVVAIIYESRPNVTSDGAALCLKSGNVAVLRGGKEAYRTSKAIVNAMRGALSAMGLDPDYINIIDDTTRKSANELMTAVGVVDLLIPRGGAGLIRACVENAKVPCIQTGTGICHLYIHEKADFKMALDILENGKTSRPSVCNALEVCLVDKKIAKEFLPLLKKRLVDERIEKGKEAVELRLDEISGGVIEGKAAGENDFDTEFLDYVLAVGVVDGINDAVSHIAKHSTGHSEAIITDDSRAAEYFTRSVDSAAVYVNASTRFTDGGEFGLGCEIGISTQKLHARGPMGLYEMTTCRYIIEGKGHVR